jgi:hypothetical protein
MGAEAHCVGRFNNEYSEGRAQLETDFLLFRGSFRVKVPFKEIQNVSAAGGQLSVVSGQGTLQLDLGAAAVKWLQKILNPPTLMDKLGVKPGAAVSVIGMGDESFLAALRAITSAVRTTLTPKSDFVFAGVESQEDLQNIAKIPANLSPAGALWVIWPKGQKHITEAQVMAAGKAAGLVDTKIASFSATHTALKLVIPVARRTASRAL